MSKIIIIGAADNNRNLLLAIIEILRTHLILYERSTWLYCMVSDYRSIVMIIDNDNTGINNTSELAIVGSRNQMTLYNSHINNNRRSHYY